ncbi:DUF3013 family protein [Vagococcus sp. JNUCC 83]
MKDNMLTELEKQLEKSLGDFDFAIDWDVKQHRIEVSVVLFAENKLNDVIEDEEGTQSEEEVIEFEDSLVLYADDKQTPDELEYLTVIPFNRKKGMTKGDIIALANYLAEVLVNGQDDLLDFLNDETIETFELVWNDAAFEEMKKNNNETAMVAYPKY